MNDETFLNEYFTKFHQALKNDGVYSKIISLRDEMLRVKQSKCKVMLAGNGASASIASHFALDFTKQGKVRSICFNDPSLITAYSNDYGYENWVMKAIEHQGMKSDAVILISSSGCSSNMVKAANKAREKGISVVTFTGFAADNPLRSLGDINLWVDSRAYNIVESTHSFWLAATCDLLIGKSKYAVNV